MKKFLSLLLVVVLTATLAVGGTLAYLTDRDSKVNVFTVGDVSIELNEKFDQGSALIPGVVIEKEPTITNTGKNSAWVWAEIAVPHELNSTSSAAKNIIHFNMSAESVADGQWNWWDGADYSEDAYFVNTKTINGVEYDVYTVQYETALKPGETTANPVIYKVYLDPHVDIDPEGNWAWVENGVVTPVAWNSNTNGSPAIYVSAYAAQVEGFADVYVAYDAYQAQWGDNGAEWAETVKVSGADKTAVVNAIANAKDGDIIVLSEDTTIAGYNGKDKLVIEKAVTLDLNGKTLTTECGWGGIDLKGGASIINGTIKHTGNTAAIKVFQAERIANVTIDVTETAGKTKGGIVVQEGAECYVGSIENVTITGATNGIELYHSTNEAAIGSMKNVTIDATANGIYLNGAGKIGSISNCKINGGNIGINAYLANLWHIALDIENSEITGGVSGIDIWDEAKANTGSTVTFNYDSASTFAGGTNDIKVTLQGEITCTINGVVQTAP